MENEKKHNAPINFLFLLTIIVNVLIPKAGIKIAGIPITLGSVLLGLLIVYSLFTFKDHERRFTVISFTIIFSMVYWFERIVFSYLLMNRNETLSMYSVGNVISYVIALVIYALMFFVTLKYAETEMQVQIIFRCIRVCLIITMLYSLLQFFFGIGKTSIPGITVNLSDYIAAPDNWWLQKHNQIGSGKSKIVSTYQNGNIYGVNLLLLFPIASSTPRKTFNKIVEYLIFILFIITIIISASRTAVFGLMFYLLIKLVKYIKKNRISKNIVFYLPVMTCMVFVIAVQFRGFLSNYIERILKAMNFSSIYNASGRTDSLMEYFHWLNRDGNVFAFLFGGMGYHHTGSSYEVLPGTLFILGGLAGMILFYLPIIMVFIRLRKCEKHKKQAAALRECIIVYLFVSIVEGAFWVIPTAINYWLIMGSSCRIICLEDAK